MILQNYSSAEIEPKYIVFNGRLSTLYVGADSQLLESSQCFGFDRIIYSSDCPAHHVLKRPKYVPFR
jgi:hypothetical protein